MLRSLTEVLRLIGPQRRRRFVQVGALALVVTGLEAVAAVLVLVLMRLVLEPGDIPELPLVGDPTRWLPGRSHEELVIGFAVGFAVFFVIRGLGFLLQQYAMVRVTEETGVQIAERLISGYLAMPYELHLRRNSAELIRNTHDDVQQLVGHVLLPMVTLVAEATLVLALVTVLVLTAPGATLAAVVAFGVMIWATLTFAHPRLQRLGRMREEGAQAAIQHLQQALGGLRDLKLLHRERAFSRQFLRARQTMARAQYSQVLLSYVPRIGIETTFLLFVLTLLSVTVLSDSVAGLLPMLGLFAYVGFRIQPSLQKIALSVNHFRYAEAAVQQLTDDLRLIEATAEVLDDPEPLPFTREIRLEGVGFSYEGAEPALRDVDLVIRRGESVGVAGTTGGGKTTLLDLLCGLLAPTEGRITVDGVDVATRRRAWQRNLGVVHQTPFLVDDTLRRNIAFGVPGDEVDEDLLARAVEIAELSAVVAGLPGGLETMVGERGVRLSGGQRQRVTLARALYRRPTLLILDEGTAALDNTTEARIIRHLEQLRGDTTLVIVAHRLSTIRDCDRILLLERGRIRASGTYDELRRSDASFRALTV